MINKE